MGEKGRIPKNISEKVGTSTSNPLFFRQIIILYQTIELDRPSVGTSNLWEETKIKRQRMALQSKEFSYEIPVLWSQCDPNGHLNVGNFQVFLHEGRMVALEEAGYSYTKLREENVGPMILRSETDYKAEIRYPESIQVVTTFAELDGSRVKIFQKLVRKSDGKVACDSVSSCILFDFAKKRPWKYPEDLYNGLGFRETA
ncbi:acyl-CoA thioester hydrolase, YbgC/YbaW family [Leptospira kmetyi serovar Malaysia str. Bejo-Iso9]|nr:acyl-CoA thioester hydrolase, YbgC/YbaW family [Leptospira kmetyi serovar Malaysia str. Bejo-Iso9]